MNITHRDQLGTLLNSLGLTGQGVEVGVGWGGYSEQILKNWAGQRLWLIDPLIPMADYMEAETNTPERHRRCLAQLQALLELYHPRAVYLPITSSESLNLFGYQSLDFVYIDANHELEHALFDIEHWYFKVKPGGIFCGHDYVNETGPNRYCQVLDALTEWNKLYQLPIHTTDCTSWWIRKP